MVTVHAVAVVVSWEITQANLRLGRFNLHGARLRSIVYEASLDGGGCTHHLIVLPDVVVVSFAIQRVVVGVLARPLRWVLRNRSEHI